MIRGAAAETPPLPPSYVHALNKTIFSSYFIPNTPPALVAGRPPAPPLHKHVLYIKLVLCSYYASSPPLHSNVLSI